jgi:hypothetical protein
MNRLLYRLLAPGLLLLLPATAMALDTLDVFGPGLSTLEISGSRYGYGLDDLDRSGYRFRLNPFWGLSPSSHAYLGLEVGSSDRHQGGLELLTLGIFRTVIDNTFKVDLFGEISAMGPGLQESRRSLGMELNLDGETLGLYFRDTWQWVSDSVAESDSLMESDQVPIARLTRWTYGLKLELTGNSELLVELRRESSRGFLSRTNSKHDLGWALGQNLRMGRGVKIITEAFRVTTGDSGDHWEFTLGIRRNW